MIEECVSRITAALRLQGVSKATIAGFAKVHVNTLGGYDAEGWNPKIETLDRIMRVVDALLELAQT